MTALQILPVLAYVGCVITILMVSFRFSLPKQLIWQISAILGALFLIFSLVTVSREGLTEFWVNHTSSFSGNQVWFDLLFAITIGFYLIAPRARAVGMRLLPWGVAVLATACIALLPMLARLIWLEQRSNDTQREPAREA
jgi:hypothetical protein